MCWYCLCFIISKSAASLICSISDFVVSMLYAFSDTSSMIKNSSSCCLSSLCFIRSSSCSLAWTCLRMLSYYWRSLRMVVDTSLISSPPHSHEGIMLFGSRSVLTGTYSCWDLFSVFLKIQIKISHHQREVTRCSTLTGTCSADPYTKSCCPTNNM